MEKDYNFIYELTTLCNFKCIYCSRRDIGNNEPWSELETAYKICDFFNNLTNYINFSPLYRTSKLYKYLAFKENLTDDQIQLAIDKYGFKYPLQLVFNNDFNNDFKWN